MFYKTSYTAIDIYAKLDVETKFGVCKYVLAIWYAKAHVSGLRSDCKLYTRIDHLRIQTYFDLSLANEKVQRNTCHLLSVVSLTHHSWTIIHIYGIMRCVLFVGTFF